MPSHSLLLQDTMFSPFITEDEHHIQASLSSTFSPQPTKPVIQYPLNLWLSQQSYSMNQTNSHDNTDFFLDTNDNLDINNTGGTFNFYTEPPQPQSLSQWSPHTMSMGHLNVVPIRESPSPLLIHAWTSSSPSQFHSPYSQVSHVSNNDSISIFSSSLPPSHLPDASSPSSSSPYSPRSSLPTPSTPASARHLIAPSPVMAAGTSLLLQPEANEGGKYTHREQLQLFREALTLPMDNGGEFLPQQMYKPHTTSDRKRYVEEVRLDAPLYFYTEHPDQCGISLKDALQFRTKNLRNRDMVVFENRGPSVSIRLEWPGYRQWSRQIPTKDFRSPPGPITLAKLAKNVAKCVQRFMQDRKSLPMEEDGNPLWRIGDGPGDIKLEDLVLVSIHHVSLGSWQPQLRLIRPRRQQFHHAARSTQMTMPMSHHHIPVQMTYPVTSSS